MIPAADLVASYDATSDALEQSSEEKPAGMMTDEFLVRAFERISGEQGNEEAEAHLAEIQRRGLDA